jgi:hypothetical protein
MSGHQRGTPCMITSWYRDRNKPTFEKDYEVQVGHELHVDEEDDDEEDDESDEEQDDESDEDDNTDDGADILIRSKGRGKKQRR